MSDGAECLAYGKRRRDIDFRGLLGFAAVVMHELVTALGLALHPKSKRYRFGKNAGEAE